LEGEKEGGEKIEGAIRTGGSSLQAAEAATNNATTISVAEEAENATSVDDNRACSDRRS